MNIIKLDKRFKLCKMGICTHRVQISLSAAPTMFRALEQAYGAGYFIGNRTMGAMANCALHTQNDWYYSMVKTKVFDANRRHSRSYGFRHDYHIYCRRQEQVTYIGLLV
jgi:hypothetical protein